jgi:hypothetical protein
MEPQSEALRAARISALQLIGQLKQTSRLLAVQGGSEIPRPFLVLAIFWLSMLFLSYAIFAPLNATVIAAMIICALSVSVAVNLIGDIDHPFSGFVRVSPLPMQQALDQMLP